MSETFGPRAHPERCCDEGSAQESMCRFEFWWSRFCALGWLIGVVVLILWLLRGRC